MQADGFLAIRQFPPSQTTKMHYPMTEPMATGLKGIYSNHSATDALKC